MSPKSAIPDFYYFCFGAYEPFLTAVGFLGAIMYVCLSSSNILSNSIPSDPTSVRLPSLLLGFCTYGTTFVDT